MKRITLVLALLASICTASYAQTLNVASYNIRNKNSSDSLNGNGWAQRQPVICQMIRHHDFDIFGAQEVIHVQLKDMLAAIPEYSYIGVGRSDGKTKGEYAPIFYKKSRLTLLNSGNFWLAENTTMPNKGWDAAQERICTWGEFRDNLTGKTFFMFNTHFDHKGTEARRESSRLILAKAGKIAGDNATIITGDFNFDQNDHSYAIIVDSDRFSDSYNTATMRYAQNGTFNRFDPDFKSDSRIDHIFVTPSVKVLRYAVLTDTYWSTDQSENQKNSNRIPSDHYPVSTQLSPQ